MEKLIKLNRKQRINPEYLDYNFLGKALIDEQVLSRYFGPITANSYDEEFLNFAYVTDTARDSYLRRLIKYFEKVSEYIGHTLKDQQQEKKSISYKAFHDEFVKDLYKGIQENSEKIFYIVGGIGSGKTIFINYFFRIEQRAKLSDKKCTWFRFSLRNTTIPKFEESIKRKIIFIIDKYYPEIQRSDKDTLYEIWKNDIINYCKRYNLPTDISEMSDEVKSDIYKTFQEREEKDGVPSDEYVRNLLEYIRKKLKYTLCLIFDNLDQENEDDIIVHVIDQSYAYAKKYKAICVITLREDTYAKLQKGIGRTHEFPRDREFILRAPNFNDILGKRIGYIKSISGLSQFTFRSDKTYTIKDFHAFLDILTEYFIERRVDEKLIIASLCEGCIREAFKLLECIIISGIINYEDMIILYKTKQLSSGDYRGLNKYAIIRALILNHYKYYIPERSFIQNLFDNADILGKRSYFLRIHILKYIDQLLKLKCDEIHINSIHSIFEKIGFDSVDIYNSLHVLEHNKMIRNINFDCLVDENCNKSYMISAKGLFYLNHILSTFSYIQYMLEDTYIPFDLGLELLSYKTQDEKYIKNKIVHVKTFMDFLQQRETYEVANLKDKDNEEYSIIRNLIMPDLRMGIDSEIEKIQTTLKH